MDLAEANVTQLLHGVRGGDAAARDQLMPLVYAELRRIANRHMHRERTGHTLQATALVHEAYMRLIDQNGTDWQNRSHFFGIASQLMRRILVDHARMRRADKRGGDQIQVTLMDELPTPDLLHPDLLDLDRALTKLAMEQERLAKVVELRYFGGLEIQEVAEALGCSAATVKRDWLIAKAWLFRELSGDEMDR